MHRELIPTARQKMVARDEMARWSTCIGLIPTPYYKVTSTGSER
jgi:hypothetical protein